MAHVKIPDVGGATMLAADVGGLIQPHFMKSEQELRKIFDEMPNFPFRKDDIVVFSYPKAGSNWLHEILNMLINRSTEKVKTPKIAALMECNSAEMLEKLPSPRAMNIHYGYRFLPLKGLREKQVKTILCLRNPKDTVVSYYNHVRGIKWYQYSGMWSDMIPAYIEGKYEYGKYTDYLKEFETAIKDGVGFPLYVMYYEDLKENGLEELDKLAAFLEIEIEDDLKKEIEQKCGFESMLKKDWGNVSRMFNEGYSFLRRGKVGDWKNWFTVAQNEVFDRVWKSEMKGYDMFQFKYTI